jgi:AAA domain, putative AbiEii toxin, Type IV TA system
VARAQSERLLQWLNNGQETIFPIPRKFPTNLRDRLNDTIFHGARVDADRKSAQSRLLLKTGKDSATQIPYMAWTAGQREFVPLLMALYRLLPSSASTKDSDIHTVVIEEPELGLHPKAVFALGHAVLHLMARGYRVAISSHSPLILDFAWTLRRLKYLYAQGHKNLKPWREALEISSTFAEKLTATTVRTYYLGYDTSKNRVRGEDISQLRTNSDNPAEAAWGLMQEDAARMADIVSQMNIDFGSSV